MRLRLNVCTIGRQLPEPATGAAGFRLPRPTRDPPRSIRLVGTGLVIAVPDGHFLDIARSSTPFKRG
jgi:dUTPase